MAQEITSYDEVSTIDKNTKLLLTKDGGLGQKSIEEVGNVINGTGDISGIGDGTVKGAIRGLNDEITVNLLNATMETSANNGVTCTRNSDNSYTLSGTAIESGFFNIYVTKLPIGKYKILGAPNSHSNHLYITKNTDYSWIKYSGDVFDVIDNSMEFVIVIRTYADGVYNNLNFKPIITSNLKAEIDDFVTYTGNTGHINSDLAALVKRVEALEGNH